MIGKFESTFSVQADKETGQIVGWDQFFAHVEANANTLGMKEEVEQKLERKMQATFVIKESTPPNFVLYNT